MGSPYAGIADWSACDYQINSSQHRIKLEKLRAKIPRLPSKPWLNPSGCDHLTRDTASSRCYHAWRFLGGRPRTLAVRAVAGGAVDATSHLSIGFRFLHAARALGGVHYALGARF